MRTKGRFPNGGPFAFRDAVDKPFGIIDIVNTLQFIVEMTRSLAWPLAAVVLGITFRRSVAQLLGRVRKLKWGEKEAELEQLAEATKEAEKAVEETAQPLLEDAEDRERVLRLVGDAARWGQLTSMTGLLRGSPSTNWEVPEFEGWKEFRPIDFGSFLNQIRLDSASRRDRDDPEDDPPLMSAPR